MYKARMVATLLALILGGGVVAAQRGPAANMSFFVTSAGKGDGGNLGGLSGADAQCFKLATAAGAAQHNWRAYLSTNGPGGVNAKDRIGVGPWFNYKGVRVASNVSELHSDHANIDKMTALTEKGQLLNLGIDPSKHIDIVTGSQADGTAVALPVAGRGRGARGGRGRGGGGNAADARGARGTVDGAPPPPPDTTCRNWTSNAPDATALVGHVDSGPWNSAHSANSCSAPALLYCFAID